MPSYGPVTFCPACQKPFKPIIYVVGPQICCSLKCRSDFKVSKFYQKRPIISNKIFLEVPLTNAEYFLIDFEDKYLVDYQLWGISSEGYVYRTTKKKGQRLESLLHRTIFKVTNSLVEIDHKNLNKLDNRRSNLRKTLHHQNSQNLPSQNGTSKYRGVRFAHGKWESYSHLDSIPYYLGRYNTEITAARISESFRRKHMSFSIPIITLDPLPECRCNLCR
jgi:hypothetical protein